MNVLSFVSGVLVIYVLFRHSPSSFGRFKYLMINVTTSEIIYMLFAYYVFQPVPLFPSYACICLGPARYLGENACVVAAQFFIVLLAYSIVSLTICFIYRYSLLAPEWIGRILAKNIVLLVIFTFMLSTISVPVITLWTQHDTVENIKHEIIKTRPEWTAEISEYTYFGISPGFFAYVFMSSPVLLLVCNTLISLCFTYLIYRELHKHKSIMSKNTLQMHRTLINILLAQTIIPMCCICLPLALVVYLVITNNVNDALMHIAHAPLAMYPFINSCLFLRFSPPHRRAVTDILRSVRILKQPTKVINVRNITVSRVSNSRI